MFTEFQKSEILYRIGLQEEANSIYKVDPDGNCPDIDEDIQSLKVLRDKVEQGRDDFTAEEAGFIHSELYELIRIARTRAGDFESNELFFLTTRRLNDARKRIEKKFPQYFNLFI
jgi:hypothetical protein